MTNPRDLIRLNAAEREILALLAEGHTAKSIATETGRSVGAVNERLREARRKTGVGSSRELARLLRAEESRENRDEHFGVDPPSAPGTAPRHPRRRRWQVKVLIMMIIIAGVAVAMALLAPAQQAAPVADPLFTAAIGDEPAELEDAHAKLHAEARDPAWAAQAEQVLRTRYAAVPRLDMPSLKITCGATLCEVVGRSAEGAATAAVRRAERMLGSRELRASLVAEGLHVNLSSVRGYAQDGAYHLSFYTYWLRQPTRSTDSQGERAGATSAY